MMLLVPLFDLISSIGELILNPKRVVNLLETYHKIQKTPYYLQQGVMV